MNIDIENLIKEDIVGRSNKTLREKALRSYYENPNHCLNCNEIIIVGKNDTVSDVKKKKFCNLQCSHDYVRNNSSPKNDRLCRICGDKICHENQSGLCMTCLRKEREKEKIQNWKETGDTGCGVSSTLRNCIRDYIFEKQNKRCAICNIDAEWNGKELHFVLDHIDGNASNNSEHNMRLLCPNCDSQLDTYKSKNKNSARTHRKKY